MKLIKQILGILGIVAFGLIGFVLMAVICVVGGIIFAMTQFNTQAWIEFSVIVAIIISIILIVKRRKIKSSIKSIVRKNKETKEFDYDKWAIENKPAVRDLYLAQIKFSPTSKRKDHDDLKLNY